MTTIFGSTVNPFDRSDLVADAEDDFVVIMKDGKIGKSLLE